jgi:hypothetical protein
MTRTLTQRRETDASAIVIGGGNSFRLMMPQRPASGWKSRHASR